MEIITETERIRFIRPNVRYVKEMLATINNPEVSNLVGDRDFDFTEEDEINWINKPNKL